MSNSQTNLAAQWRDGADIDNPAGPLFAGGEYAAADIVAAAEPTTLGGVPCSACTGSHTNPCC
ncbi:MAG TPA: DUF6229 family protein [Rhizomicrobium sp.]